MKFKKYMMFTNKKGQNFVIEGFNDENIVLCNSHPNSNLCLVLSEEEIEKMLRDEGWKLLDN